MTGKPHFWPLLCDVVEQVCALSGPGTWASSQVIHFVMLVIIVFLVRIDLLWILLYVHTHPWLYILLSFLNSYVCIKKKRIPQKTKSNELYLIPTYHEKGISHWNTRNITSHMFPVFVQEFSNVCASFWNESSWDAWEK